MAITIKVNGVDRTVDVDGDTPLLWVLRDVLGMTGTKFGCGMALCGACTVHVDGVATRSCITSIDSIGSSEITTIEAIGATAAGAKLQKAWLDREVVQCDYCQSGQIMSASALLASNPHPTDADIDAMRLTVDFNGEGHDVLSFSTNGDLHGMPRCERQGRENGQRYHDCEYQDGKPFHGAFFHVLPTRRPE